MNLPAATGSYCREQLGEQPFQLARSGKREMSGIVVERMAGGIVEKTLRMAEDRTGVVVREALNALLRRRV